jgi:3-phosphoshikimate 1-carboxyvinyltransferase
MAVAILLAGLRGDGTTRVREAVATRDHSERMLRARGVPVRSLPDGGGGAVVEIEGGKAVQAIDERVPGDPSAAAFWLVAAAIHPGIGEPIVDLVVRSSDLVAIDLGPADVAAAIDEIPILCLAATQARGRTTIRGAAELRHKESDRLAGIVAGLGALGARVDVDGDDLAIGGPVRLTGAATDSLDDHRLAMTFAIAGLLATGRTTVGRPRSASISYPGFYTDLERIRA